MLHDCHIIGSVPLAYFMSSSAVDSLPHDAVDVLTLCIAVTG